MQVLNTVLLTLQVISSILVIVLVLLQQGKGADMGAAFGSGSAGSVFGSAGAANFLSRTTKWAAIVFFVTTGGLAWVAHHPAGSALDSGIMSGFVQHETKKPAPAPASNVGSAVPDVAPAAPAQGSPSSSAAENAAGGAAQPSTGTAQPGASNTSTANQPSPALGADSVPSVPPGSPADQADKAAGK